MSGRFRRKDLENRAWNTHYRGPVAIHAGMAYKTDVPLPRGVHAPGREDLEFGALLGVDVTLPGAERAMGDCSVLAGASAVARR